jgi:hypothetical protein
MRVRTSFRCAFENDGRRAFLRDCAQDLRYISDMTKEQIQAIFERVITWPPERLDRVAGILLEMEAADDAAGDGFWPLTDEERAELEEAEREIERGEVASDEEVAALYRLAGR